MNYNKIVLVGRVGKDPELKATPNGNSVCTLSLATTRHWSQDGQKKEETSWHNIVAWGKTAEIIERFVTKGQLLLIEGRSHTRTWDDEKSGKKMYRTEIIVENVQLPPRSTEGSDDSGDESEDDTEKKSRTAKKTFTKKVVAKSARGDMAYPEDEINPDDIPF